MYLFNFIVFLLSVFDSHQKQEYNPNKFRSKTNAAESSHRILELMRSYYEEANARIKYMNHIRFMYEESPYYEMGYITGEIIERYRKVVEHAQRPVRFLDYTVFDTLKRVELVQKLYFELYHLVRMIHETPRKWREVPEFGGIEQKAGLDAIADRLAAGTPPNGTDGMTSDESLAAMLAMQKQMEDTRKRREKDMKRQRKKNEKIRQAYMLGLIQDMRGKGKAYNTQWPVDYGWEIDYDWRGTGK